MPTAVAALSDKGRPQFEIAERVRRVRQMVEAGRIDDAKRSVMADMFEYAAPLELAPLLSTSHRAAPAAVPRFGRGALAAGGGGGAGLREAFAPTGSVEGRALLEAEWRRLAARHAALLDRGIELRLAGTGRAAPPSSGAPGQHQGNDLYRWNVWLFGFESDAIVANNLKRRALARADLDDELREPLDASMRTDGRFGRQLVAYNDAAKKQCQYVRSRAITACHVTSPL
jgi:hypothetical protein